DYLGGASAFSGTDFVLQDSSSAGALIIALPAGTTAFAFDAGLQANGPGTVAVLLSTGGLTVFTAPDPPRLTFFRLASHTPPAPPRRGGGRGGPAGSPPRPRAGPPPPPPGRPPAPSPAPGRCCWRACPWRGPGCGASDLLGLAADDPRPRDRARRHQAGGAPSQ